jgi:hypothetical protein
MSETGGYEAFCLYNALKLHFTTKYDFVKYSGKTSVSKDSFMLRKDKFSFYKISRKYNREDMFGFFVANLLEKPTLWAGELLSEDAESVYKVWLKTQQSLSYIFEQNLSYMLDEIESPEELLKVVDGQYPILYNMHLMNKVSLETVMILNDIMNFMPMWSKKIEDDIIFPDFVKRCQKYKPFLNYDKVKFKNMLRDKICQAA